MAWPVFHLGGAPDFTNDKPNYFGRPPPSQINLLVVATGGEGCVGGGGGGGVIIRNNYTTGFTPWSGPPNPKNKYVFTLGSRANASGNNRVIDMHTYWKTYNQDGTAASTTTIYMGGEGGCDCQSGTGDGGSGGGGGGDSCFSGAGPSLAGQGNRGGDPVGGKITCSYYLRICIMGYAQGGGGGGYSSAGGTASTSGICCTCYNQGNVYYPRGVPGTGGTGLNLAPYLSSYLQTIISGGNSVLANAGYTGYNTLWASSGGGACGAVANLCPGICCDVVRGSKSSSGGGPGAGSGDNPSATGFGCGSGGGAYYGVSGPTGASLVIASYQGKPATLVSEISQGGYGLNHYDTSTDKTYHVLLGPPDSTYTNYSWDATLQF